MDNDFANKAQKIAFTLVVISILGLFTIPLFPWFGIEGDLYNRDTEEEVRVTDYEAGHSGILHAYAETSGVPDEVEDLDRDITIISICFWLSLILGVCALGGVALYRTQRYEGLAHSLLIIGSFVIIFSLIALIFHGLFFADLGALGDEVSDDNEVHYGYNFFPLIFILILFIVSLVYLFRIVPFSKRSLSSVVARGGYGAPYGYSQSASAVPQYQEQQSVYSQLSSQTYQQDYHPPYQQQYSQPQSVQSQPPTEVTCPTCKYRIAVQIKSLPAPIKCPQCGTRGFIE